MIHDINKRLKSNSLMVAWSKTAPKHILWVGLPIFIYLGGFVLWGVLRPAILGQGVEFQYIDSLVGGVLCLPASLSGFLMASKKEMPVSGLMILYGKSAVIVGILWGLLWLGAALFMIFAPLFAPQMLF